MTIRLFIEGVLWLAGFVALVAGRGVARVLIRWFGDPGP
jgi:hypothetical protein